MIQKEKKYTLKIQGKEIEVSEEVYRAYVRPLRAEQRQRRREWKCKLLSKNGGHYIRCKDRCETCPYYQSGNNALGNKLSLDKMADDGVDLADDKQDVERLYIEKEVEREELFKLRRAILKLSKREQEIIKMLYFENKTTVEISAILGVSHQAISKEKKKIIEKLKNIF